MGGAPLGEDLYCEYTKQNGSLCKGTHPCKAIDLQLSCKDSYGEVLCMFSKNCHCEHILLGFGIWGMFLKVLNLPRGRGEESQYSIVAEVISFRCTIYFIALEINFLFIEDKHYLCQELSLFSLIF